MYTLIIDSSTKILYCALVEDEKVVCERYIMGQNDHAKNIVMVIEEFLNQQSIKAMDLRKVICGQGPGSYTGVRMAVTVAKMLASLSTIELYSISSLALMSSTGHGKTIAMIDARRGNVFGGVYDNLELLGDEMLINREELLAKNSIFDHIVTETEFKVNPLAVMKMAKRVKNPFSFAPNYLRQTEAERNQHA